MNFAKVCEAEVELYTPAKFIHGPCPFLGGHLIIARFYHYIQREHSITPLLQNQVLQYLAIAHKDNENAHNNACHIHFVDGKYFVYRVCIILKG